MIEQRYLRTTGIEPARGPESLEKQYILNILEKVQWNQTEAARVLGLLRNTLLWKLQRLGIEYRPHALSA